jgi:hypothetical protein
MQALLEGILGYFSWDWPWIVVGVTATSVILFRIYLKLVDYKTLPGEELILPLTFIVLLIIPFSIPVIALLGDDFWLPLISMVFLYVIFMKPFKNEASMGIIWHFAGLLAMLPLAIAVRGLRYFIGQ